ncbi:integrase catalytic domain-containing protein [Trichonephila clavipes]|nr:integrase catalytic domain-containing protein [Trichonephila clavipes]
MLGRDSLYYEELNAVLCECEHVTNSRLLTHISVDVNDLSPLTSDMFLQKSRNICHKLREQTQHHRKSRPLTVGEVVVVENSLKTRTLWSLTRVIQLIPGKDGYVRVTRVKTETGELVKPVQRLYNLELQGPEINLPKDLTDSVIRTRRGRKYSVPTTSNSEHSNAPEIPKCVKRNSRNRRKRPKVQKAEIEIKMTPHRPRKSAPTELTTDDEDMITYDVEEEELEPDPTDKLTIKEDPFYFIAHPFLFL